MGTATKIEIRLTCEHRWTKWQTVDAGTGIVGAYEYQRRECETCGESALREIWARAASEVQDGK